MQSGTSVIDCTSSIVCARMAGSSASGMPALTSSICAPASTWAIASATTVSKFPAAISAASCFRPVGLIRSPMITNGRSKPIATSFVAEDRTVSVTRSPFRSRGRAARARRRCKAASSQAASVGHLRLEVVAARAALAPPLLEVGVAADQPGSHRGGVDRLLEALRELDAGGAATRACGHLRRDVAPPDHGELRQLRPRGLSPQGSVPHESRQAPARARRSRCGGARRSGRAGRPLRARGRAGPGSSVCAR